MISSVENLIQYVKIDLIDYLNSSKYAFRNNDSEDEKNIKLNIAYLCYLEQIDDNELTKLNNYIDIFKNSLINIENNIFNKNNDQILIELAICCSYLDILKFLYMPKKMSKPTLADAKYITKIIEPMEQQEKNDYFKEEIDKKQIDLEYVLIKIKNIQDIQKNLNDLLNKSLKIKNNGINLEIKNQTFLQMKETMQLIYEKTNFMYKNDL